jgi:hypothetical protein
VAVRRQVGYLPGELHIEDNLNVEGVLRFLNKLRKGKADWDFVLQLAAAPEPRPPHSRKEPFQREQAEGRPDPGVDAPSGIVDAG